MIADNYAQSGVPIRTGTLLRALTDSFIEITVNRMTARPKPNVSYPADKNGKVRGNVYAAASIFKYGNKTGNHGHKIDGFYELSEAQIEILRGIWARAIATELRALGIDAKA
jgi:hypothetical protein